MIFKKDEFLKFLNLAILGGSYTKYSNKIGLSNGGRFLKINNEVVLNFSFKDCVLRSTQSKDNDKNKEIFFNKILARDEIDVLFAPKVLHNFKLIGKQESASLDTAEFKSNVKVSRIANTSMDKVAQKVKKEESRKNSTLKTSYKTPIQPKKTHIFDRI